MIDELARNHFTGSRGYKSLNCAQTIAEIFRGKFDFISEDTVSSFKKMGVGKAPEGECGMVYAAKFILERSGRAENIPDFEQFFIEKAGAVSCSEIRKKKRAFCTFCIEETAKYLDQFYKDN